MLRIRTAIACAAAVFLCGGCVEHFDYFQPSVVAGGLPSGIGHCDTIDHGMAFVGAYPDVQRRLVVGILVYGVSPPTVNWLVYRTYDPRGGGYWTEAQHRRIDAERAAGNSWQQDRSHPYAFSSDKVEITWPGGGHILQSINGLRANGPIFEGVGDQNPIVSEFDIKIRLDGFQGDTFDVTIPSVTFDGVTTPARTVHFQRAKRTAISAINC